MPKVEEGIRKLRPEKTAKTNDLVTITKNEFREKVTPEEVTDPKDLFMFQCPKCNNIHFRHAGYVEVMTPFIRAGEEKKVAKDSYEVTVCTKCKKCYIWVNEQMRDITKLVDLKAWEKTEKALHKATGPGGQC